MIPHEWTKVDSSSISRVKFVKNEKDDRGDVHVEFTTGKIYRYRDVPQIHAERLVHSSSPGKYHKDHILSGFYEMEKVQT